jgi:hypothetical protein
MKVYSVNYLTINNYEWPECIPCNSNYSLKHVLIDCVDVSYNLYDLFTNVAGDTILKFLKEINLYANILLASIRSKYMVLPFKVSLICT